MLNGQLKPFATTSPRPLIRGSSDFYSLYSTSAGGPIVCGVLEDCTDCNQGSFISAEPGGGLILNHGNEGWSVVSSEDRTMEKERKKLNET